MENELFFITWPATIFVSIMLSGKVGDWFGKYMSGQKESSSPGDLYIIGIIATITGIGWAIALSLICRHETFHYMLVVFVFAVLVSAILNILSRSH
jgi:predicted acyltransferase